MAAETPVAFYFGIFWRSFGPCREFCTALLVLHRLRIQLLLQLTDLVTKTEVSRTSETDDDNSIQRQNVVYDSALGEGHGEG